VTEFFWQFKVHCTAGRKTPQSAQESDSYCQGNSFCPKPSRVESRSVRDKEFFVSG
jgi:hypothetical protein